MGKAITKAKEIAKENIEAATDNTGAPLENEQAAAQPEAPAASLDWLEGADLSVYYEDEPEAQDTTPAPWRIADDGAADWAVRKIAEERAELARIRELAEAEIERIEAKLAAAEKRCENGTRFLTAKLAEYFSTVPHKATKTKESYRLLSGTLTMKIGGTQMKQDDEALLAFLKQSGNDDMIQITEKPRWGEYKKRLQIVGGSVVDSQTGEIVEGVTVIEKPNTFSVDV